MSANLPRTRAEALPSNPLKNPTYPQREHIHERTHWLEVLHAADEQVAVVSRKFEVLGANPGETYTRLFAQLLGARDQIAETVRRLPGETGGLYEEDMHRLEEARAALSRVVADWDKAQR